MKTKIKLTEKLKKEIKEKLKLKNDDELFYLIEQGIIEIVNDNKWLFKLDKTIDNSYSI